jgi:DNA topoisomerase-2
MALVEKTNKAPKKAASSKGAVPAPIVDDDDDVFAMKENMAEDAVPKKKTPKKKTVEETYQKLTQLEHVLLRPDTYIGSTEMNRTKLWVFDTDAGLNQREVTYVPGAYA